MWWTLLQRLWLQQVIFCVKRIEFWLEIEPQLQPNMTISINAVKPLGSFGSLEDATDAQEAAKNGKRKPVTCFWKEIVLHRIKGFWIGKSVGKGESREEDEAWNDDSQ